jgi:RNA polymerase sigma factor (sigma-70 family)
MGSFYALSELSLDDLVAAAQAKSADDTEEMAEILRRFDGAIMKIARSYSSDANIQHDAAQAARLGLVKAVRGHKLGTPGFTTYAWRFMKGDALREIKSLQTPEIVNDPTEPAWLDQPERDAVPDTTFEVIDLMNVLAPEQQKLAKAHYIGGAAFKDIAEYLHISRPAVTQRFAVIHRTLRTAVEGALAA